ncbi:penicillin-binding transpeptidase domain-containing protein [Zhihengliuella sp.]|uniref:penicillin-binding transpeptidase domain-containing protein n=1 Tax=Zhihengliuella sp. TaxID=1954483 RepID=UPI002812050F|nr:penicillin-binding transpeptidase domain-containing protein [Zhihengliuella sp.]
MRPLLRGLGLVSVLSLAGASLAACSPAPPDPRPAAEALVEALDAGDLSAVPMTGVEPAAATETLTTAYGSLEAVDRDHSLVSVAVDEDSAEGDGPATATGTIRTVWDMDETDNDFTYETRATWELDEESDRWQLRFDPALLAPDLAAGESLAVSYEPAPRGEILGAGGDVLVTERPVVRVGIDKTRAEADTWESSARALAELVGVDPDAYAERVAAAGERAWVEAIVLRDDETRTATDAEIAAIPGAAANPDTLPLAPTRTFARPLLGSVGQATAEIIEASDGRVSAGDQVGLSGLQSAYDATLAGTAGLTVSRYSAEGEPVAELFSAEPAPGADVETTLDRDLQALADSLIADSASPASIVAVRPSDGAVLAAASGPEDNGYNTALLGRYAPGSTFKVVTALAMLRDGATPETEVQCPETITVDGRSFKNYDGYPESSLGTITLAEALAQSCNTVFIQAAGDLGAPALAEAAAALGLTAEAATGLEAFLGSVAADSTGTELGANGIGQGVVQSSPLGMATVMASVVAGGTVQPRLVVDPAPEGAASATGSPAESTPPSESDSSSASDSSSSAAPAESALTDEEAGTLAAMMAGTVERGTLTDLQSVPGAAVIGKSGTAEYDAEQNAHAWVIAAQEDLAVVAFVEDGQGGSQTAGPLVRDFLTGAREASAAE